MATNPRIRFSTKTPSTAAAPPYTATAGAGAGAGADDEDENPIPDLGALEEQIGRHFAQRGVGDANQAKKTMLRFVRKAELFTKNMQDAYHKLFGDLPPGVDEDGGKFDLCPKHSGEVCLVPSRLCVMHNTHRSNTFCCM